MARPVFLVLVYKKGYRWNSPARLLNVFPEPFTPSPTCAGDRKVPRLCTTHCLVFWSVIFGIWILSTSQTLLVHLYIRYLGSDITFFLETVKALLPVSQTLLGHSDNVPAGNSVPHVCWRTCGFLPVFSSCSCFLWGWVLQLFWRCTSEWRAPLLFI